MEDTLNIFDFFKTIKKRWKIITIIAMTTIMIGSIYTYFILTPIYQASTTILVNQRNSENLIGNSDVQSNAELINTYSMIIKSPVILDKVIKDLKLNQSSEKLNEKIQINSQQDSQVFTLVVEDSSHREAVTIANSVTEIFQKEIKNIMNVDNVNILAEAKFKENSKPITPNHLFNLTISIMVGIMAGLGIVLLLELLDKTIKSEQDVITKLGLPVLGSVQKSSFINNNTKLSLRIGGQTIESKIKKFK
jgi:capsular polysaccharide biosynthesis protein